MQLSKVQLVLVLASLSCAYAQFAIPIRPDGYGVGGPADAHVVVEMFLDLLCPDCKASWPTALQVIQAYGTKIHFRIHTFPLPYHTNAFVAAQGLHVVANLTSRNLDSIYKYATAVFDQQERWYNGATASMSMPQVIQSLGSFVDSIGIVDKARFLAAMTDKDIYREAAISWSYACTRGVSGTPTFLINGVATSADASWSLSDWQSVIDPILASNNVLSTFDGDCPSGQVQCNYAPHKSQCCLAGERCIPNVGCRC